MGVFLPKIGRDVAQGCGWLEFCTSLMPKRKHRESRSFLTREFCLEEAKKYSSIEEWKSLSQISFKAATIMEIIDQCTEHMIDISESA